MEPVFQPQVDIENMGPEVRSYIHQTLAEFEGFTTPETTVTVVARDPMKLIKEDGYENVDPKKLRRYWRFAIVIAEDGQQIEEEGVHEDIYEALRMAKDKLLKTLAEIQDQVVTTQDRVMQIQNALAGHQLH